MGGGGPSEARHGTRPGTWPPSLSPLADRSPAPAIDHPTPLLHPPPQVVRKLEAELEVPSLVRMHWTGCPNSCGQVRHLGSWAGGERAAGRLGRRAAALLSRCHALLALLPPTRLQAQAGDSPADPGGTPTTPPCLPAPRPPATSQAQVGDIGLMGAPAKLDGKAVEGVKIFLGGRIGEDPEVRGQARAARVGGLSGGKQGEGGRQAPPAGVSLPPPRLPTLPLALPLLPTCSWPRSLSAASRCRRTCCCPACATCSSPSLARGRGSPQPRRRRAPRPRRASPWAPREAAPWMPPNDCELATLYQAAPRLPNARIALPFSFVCPAPAQPAAVPTLELRSTSPCCLIPLLSPP